MKRILGIALLLAFSASNAATIARQIVHPFSDNFLGFGLANDGTSLYVSGASNNIYKVDPATLSITGSISTPATTILGLEFYNGTLFAADPTPERNDLNPSRIYSVDSSSGTLLSSFDAPTNTVVGLSVGPDGLLYAMDGYTARASAISVVYAFNSSSGALENTLTFSNSVFGADILEWVNGTVLIDDRLGSSGLSFYSSDGSVFTRIGGLEIDGLNGVYDWRGSTLMGDSLYLWAQGYGGANLFEITGISTVVPVPAAVWLFGSALGLLGRRVQRARIQNL